MGAPKKKWTTEEETALEAGVLKHGAGKWQLILRDPLYNSVLSSRSNVDLKDKWRNINVTASGLGSREKARLALKKNPEHDDNLGGSSNLVRNEEKNAESKLYPGFPSVLGDKGKAPASKKPFTRLETVILEAITSLRDPGGSDKNAIAMYIEDNYTESPDKKFLFSKLKSMTSSGRLVKVKRRYIISVGSSPSQLRPNSFNGKPKDAHKVEKNGVRIFTQPEVDADLNKMRDLPVDEVAAAAARAVVEAEAAIAEAERAEREAEAAEAEAEAAQIFAEAAMKACQKLRVY